MMYPPTASESPLAKFPSYPAWDALRELADQLLDPADPHAKPGRYAFLHPRRAQLRWAALVLGIVGAAIERGADRWRTEASEHRWELLLYGKAWWYGSAASSGDQFRSFFDSFRAPGWMFSFARTAAGAVDRCARFA